MDIYQYSITVTHTGMQYL